MSEKLTPEILRKQELELTPEQKEIAFQMVESWGWPRGSQPPLYIWHHAFHRAVHNPTNWEADFTP